MKFEEMDSMQARLHNAAIVVEAEGDDYGYAKMMLDAIDEIQRLKTQLQKIRYWYDTDGSVGGLSQIMD